MRQLQGKAMIVVALIIGYLAFVKWLRSWQDGDWPNGYDDRPLRWYQDPSYPSCVRVWIAMPLMGILLSPAGILLGYVLTTLAPLATSK